MKINKINPVSEIEKYKPKRFRDNNFNKIFKDKMEDNMFGYVKNMIDDLDLASTMIQKAKEELLKCKTDKVISTNYGYRDNDYNLAKVKRNCVTARELLLDVKKSCEESWNERC